MYTNRQKSMFKYFPKSNILNEPNGLLIELNNKVKNERDIFKQKHQRKMVSLEIFFIYYIFKTNKKKFT